MERSSGAHRADLDGGAGYPSGGSSSTRSSSSSGSIYRGRRRQQEDVAADDRPYGRRSARTRWDQGEEDSTGSWSRYEEPDERGGRSGGFSPEVAPTSGWTPSAAPTSGWVGAASTSEWTREAYTGEWTRGDFTGEWHRDTGEPLTPPRSGSGRSGGRRRAPDWHELPEEPAGHGQRSAERPAVPPQRDSFTDTSEWVAARGEPSPSRPRRPDWAVGLDPTTTGRRRRSWQDQTESRWPTTQESEAASAGWSSGGISTGSPAEPVSGWPAGRADEPAAGLPSARVEERAPGLSGGRVDERLAGPSGGRADESGGRWSGGRGVSDDRLASTDDRLASAGGRVSSDGRLGSSDVPFASDGRLAAPGGRSASDRSFASDARLADDDPRWVGIPSSAPRSPAVAFPDEPGFDYDDRPGARGGPTAFRDAASTTVFRGTDAPRARAEAPSRPTGSDWRAPTEAPSGGRALAEAPGREQTFAEAPGGGRARAKAPGRERALAEAPGHTTDWRAPTAPSGGRAPAAATARATATAPASEWRTPAAADAGRDRMLGSAVRRVATPDELDDGYTRAPGGVFAAIVATLAWYAVPLVLFAVYTLVQGDESQALGSLSGGLTRFAAALAVSLVVAVLLRWVSSTWRAISVGLAAAVVGGGLSTVLLSAISGQPLGG
ncbi:hypothetical protein [Phytohabitans kaempferiae]|uniref:Uncharacterized protein n=1 Tax=Phytohabitans kaempferiae TaxID=1620943 RepID=A0ABV6MDX7_9ACTN